MKYKIIIPIFLSLFFTQLGCKKSEENPLIAKKKELQTLVAQKSQLDEKINSLKAEIEQLEPKKEEKVKIVTAMPLSIGNLGHYVEVTGRLDAENNVLVSPKMGGAISRVYVKEGQYVKAGQLLASIDNSVMENSVAELKTRIATAQIMYDKQKALWDQKIGTEVQYIQAKSTLDALNSNLKTLQSQNAQNNVYSPISGYVDEVRTKQGEVASPGFGIIRVINFGKMKVVANIPDTYAGTISKGDLVKIQFPDLNKEVDSRVSFVSQTIDPVNRTFTVEAPVASSSEYKPNLTAIIKVNDQNSNNTIIVPRNIIQRTEQGDVVYVAENDGQNNIAKARVVQTGLISNDKIEIKSGLSSGDVIITEGYQELVDGQKIKY